MQNLLETKTRRSRKERMVRNRSGGEEIAQQFRTMVMRKTGDMTIKSEDPESQYNLTCDRLKVVDSSRLTTSSLVGL